MLTTPKVSLLSSRILTTAVLCSGLCLLLTGCGIGTPAGPAIPASQTISGKALGGNGPLGGATVNLYIAGTAGYGLGSTTPLATTTTHTDGSGYFSIDPASYTCPANRQAYLLLKGGDPNGGSATGNSAIALIAPLGTCGNLSPFTVVNEASTVATIFAAAQFFNATTETFGSASTAQSRLGLANAFALAMDIVPANLGTPGANYVQSNSGLSTIGTSGILMRATPDAGKVGAIADILSACVNTASSSSNNCTDLFHSAVGGPNAAQTSGSTQSSGSFAAATDTLIAAYYMAINPVSAGSTSGTSGTNAACYAAGVSGGTASASNLTCLYDLIPGSGSPFSTTGFTAVPADWTIGIEYAPDVGNICSGPSYFLFGPTHSAVDANGNLWFINGTATFGGISEITSTGQALACFSTLGSGGSGGSGLTIDTSGNIWAAFSSSANLSTDIEEVIPGASTFRAWPLTANAPYNIVADGNGNVFYSTTAAGGGISEFIHPGTTTTPFPPETIASAITGSSANITSGMAVDASNRIWITYSTTADVSGSYPGSATTPVTLTGYSVASNVVTYTNSGTNTLSAGGFVTIADSSPLNGQSLAVLSSPAPTSTSFAVAFSTSNTGSPVTETGTATPAITYTTGLTGAPLTVSYGMASDSNSNLYMGTDCCSGTTATRFIEKYVPASTAATTPTPTSSSSQDVGGINGVRSVAVDGAGNLWVGAEFNGNSTGTITSGSGTVAELTSSLTAISPGSNPGSVGCTTSVGCPSGGYIHAGLGYGSDISIDPSGNVWVLNNGPQTSPNTGLDIEEIIGAAVPVVTPLSVAIKNGTLATKP